MHFVTPCLSSSAWEPMDSLSAPSSTIRLSQRGRLFIITIIRNSIERNSRPRFCFVCMRVNLMTMFCFQPTDPSKERNSENGEERKKQRRERYGKGMHAKEEPW